MPATHSSTMVSSAGSCTSSTDSPDRNPSSQAAASAGLGADREPPAHPAGRLGLVEVTGVEEQPVDAARHRPVHAVAGGHRHQARLPAGADLLLVQERHATLGALDPRAHRGRGVVVEPDAGRREPDAGAHDEGVAARWRPRRCRRRARRRTARSAPAARPRRAGRARRAAWRCAPRGWRPPSAARRAGRRAGTRRPGGRGWPGPRPARPARSPWWPRPPRWWCRRAPPRSPRPRARAATPAPRPP